MSRVIKTLRVVKVSKLPKRDYEDGLMVHVNRVSQHTLLTINKTVPPAVEGMPYARQWVLEEVIKKLQESV